VPYTCYMRFERRNHGRGHSYWLDGAKMPGVTTQINDGTPKQLTRWAAEQAANAALDNWDGFTALPASQRLKLMVDAPAVALGEAARRGTAIHDLAWALIVGDEVEVPEQYAGPVAAVVQFMDEWNVTPVLRETPVFHVDHWWAGTIDLVAYIGETRWLLDWKTGRTLFESNALQLAAYNHAQWVQADGGDPAPWTPAERCGVVHIGPDSATLHPVDAGDETYRVFRHVQEVADWTAKAKDAWKEGTPWPIGASLTPAADRS
jgi:hypothetical protein